jgi:hypothetical protein
MGQFHADSDHVVQEVPNAIGGLGVYGTPAYFDAGTPNHRWVYYAGVNDALKAFQLFDDGTLSTSPTSQSSNSFSAEWGTIASVSANGTDNGVVWAIFPAGSNAVLFAYDATNLANTLYTSSQAGPRDQPDAGIKFSVPTVADGEVFIGTVDTLSVFGLLPGGGAARGRNVPVISLANSGFVRLIDGSASQETTGIRVADGSLSSERVNSRSSFLMRPILAEQDPSTHWSVASRPSSTERDRNDFAFAFENSWPQGHGSPSFEEPTDLLGSV